MGGRWQVLCAREKGKALRKLMPCGMCTIDLLGLGFPWRPCTATLRVWHDQLGGARGTGGCHQSQTVEGISSGSPTPSAGQRGSGTRRRRAVVEKAWSLVGSLPPLMAVVSECRRLLTPDHA